MKRPDRWSAIFWLLLSGGVCIHAYQLGLGRMRNPGPGFLFFWSGVILGILSILILAREITAPQLDSSKRGEKTFANVNWIKIGSVLIALVVYGLIFEWMGFLLSTIFFIGFLLYSIEAKKWYVVISVAVLSSVLSYVLFEMILQARLPKGFWGI